MSHSPKAAIASIESQFKVLSKVEFRGETSLTVSADEIVRIWTLLDSTTSWT
jgi:hypothetical protein